MDSTGNRLKLLRKTLGLNQTDFAEKIGLTFTAVSKFELDINPITEQTMKLICKEFNANREWLETGEGEMFVTPDEDDEIIDSILSGTDRQSRLTAALVKGIIKTPGGLEALAAAVKAAYEELQKIEEE